MCDKLMFILSEDSQNHYRLMHNVGEGFIKAEHRFEIDYENNNLGIYKNDDDLFGNTEFEETEVLDQKELEYAMWKNDFKYCFYTAFMYEDHTFFILFHYAIYFVGKEVKTAVIESIRVKLSEHGEIDTFADSFRSHMESVRGVYKKYKIEVKLEEYNEENDDEKG